MAQSYCTLFSELFYCLLLCFIGNAWSDINSRFNEKFTLSSYIWTKYIFETYELKEGQDQTECGVR